ncbi:hypothetical protein D3874_12870 [Oleomonas cavernae]|uniref:DUF995 domain-containing protein n=1 Tax=Oleomonas cavernae TaxID=2320859 RepID=A0A418WCQ5_9PROT|nr:hypothetical protein [Oleomonas cavernae]RJF87805.1 hypothetical protein D3874_12870 [Oleomonas cavernae]
MGASVWPLAATLALLAACPALAAEPPKRGTPLTGAEIRQLFDNNTVDSVVGVYDSTARGFHHPDGELDIYGSVRYFDHDKQRMDTYERTDTGDWWVEGDLYCIHPHKIAFGFTDCLEVRRDGDELLFYFTQCTLKSSDYCAKGRLGGRGNVLPGDQVIPALTN